MSSSFHNTPTASNAVITAIFAHLKAVSALVAPTGFPSRSSHFAIRCDEPVKDRGHPPKYSLPLSLHSAFWLLPRPLRGGFAVLDRLYPDDRGPRSRRENGSIKEVPMSIQIISTHDIRVEYRGHFYAEDELRESIWLVNMELRNGLPGRERIEAKRQIAEMEAALTALVTAEGAGR
jgi:hypothetical protein